MTRPVNDDATHQHPFTVNIEPNEKAWAATPHVNDVATQDNWSG